MTAPLYARSVMRQAHVQSGAGESDAADSLSLDYEARFLRRRRLETDGGVSVMVDLAETTSLDHGDALVLEDGTHIAITAAPEPLLRISGAGLTRLAWHIGNRHTPCQIAEDHLLIRDDHVLAAMLAGLGAEVAPVTAPFTPEGGAYGHGRTLGHTHGPAETDPHDHGHDHTHDHTHDHGHKHG